MPPPGSRAGKIPAIPAILSADTFARARADEPMYTCTYDVSSVHAVEPENGLGTLAMIEIMDWLML